MKDLISVIIPVHNGEKYLPACLDSLLLQDYKTTEILVVDNRSTDNTQSVIERYRAKDRRVIGITANEKAGVSYARNRGLFHASGKYVAFVDCDDWVEKDYLSTLYSLLDEETVFSCCKFRYQKRTRVKFLPKKGKSSFFSLEDAKEGIVFDDKLFLYVWNKLFRREICNRIRFDENLNNGEDFVFCMDYLNACSQGVVKYTDKKLYHYSITEGSLSSLTCTLERYEKLVKVLDVFSDYSEKEPSQEIKTSIRSWIFLNGILLLFYAKKLKLKEEYRRIHKITEDSYKDFLKKKKRYRVFYRRHGDFIFRLMNLFWKR